MSIDTAELLALPNEDKLRLIELLWENLDESVPLPAHVVDEGLRRREEIIADPALGHDHETVWQRIERRNG